jgi:hypothetical protein
MMPSRVANHLHRYKKINLGENGKDYFVYKCMKPACSHYIPINLAEGKLCECNKCGEPMILSKAILTHSSGKPMTKPHCGSCVKRRRDKDVEAIAAFLAGNKA